MSMKSGSSLGADAPGYTAVAVTPSNTVDLQPAARALWVAGAGTLTVIMAGENSSTTVVFTSIPAGQWMPIQVRRVMSTGTTATGIVAVF